MSEPVIVTVVDGVPDDDWNAYVERHAAGTVFHRAEWAAVYADLSWLTPRYLVARRGSGMVGIMPLAEVRWWPRGSALASAPYCVEAGPLADDAAARDALEIAARDLAHERRVDFLEVRQRCGPRAEWPAHAHFSGFARTLAPSAEENLAAVPRKQRAMIRKGEGAGLRAAQGLPLDRFYALYAASVRNLGTPVFAPSLFQAIARHFAAFMDILQVVHEGTTVAAVLSFYHRDCVLPYYAGAVPAARTLKAYDYMYWQLMCQALERGCTRFDFGRSVVDSGAYAFKKNWGFAPHPLCYQLVPVRAAGDPALDPDSPFNRFARGAWSRLPLAVANRLGPLLARRLF